METTIIQKESFMAVGVSLETLLKDERENRFIPKMHAEFEERIHEIENRINDNAIGIFIDPPNYDYKIDMFKWIAGVEVSQIENIPDGMESITIPQNTYACTIYTGARDQAYQAYDYLYKWVQESEYELADSYGIEQYKKVNIESSEEVMVLMFPIRKNR
ncbi:GyrI-like domain-containing protein [Cohnella soli]|uniref:GyrI-like domain-containing protein n=1 Tax=Cohnella soli TaxID=425005 RepID=A0ABW0HUY2_9BACL